MTILLNAERQTGRL